MRYDDFEREVPEAIKTDTLWRMPAYRCALFLSELCWHDASRLVTDRRTARLTGELYGAVGAIGASLAQAHSLRAGKDRDGFLEQGLGATRQSRDWYHKSRHVLGQRVTDHRVHLLGLIYRLVSGMAPAAPVSVLHDLGPLYAAAAPDVPDSHLLPAELGEDAPLPA
jgi:hypothetical protein